MLDAFLRQHVYGKYFVALGYNPVLDKWILSLDNDKGRRGVIVNKDSSYDIYSLDAALYQKLRELVEEFEEEKTNDQD